MKNLKPGSIWYNAENDTLVVIISVGVFSDTVSYLYGDSWFKYDIALKGKFLENVFYIGDL